MRILSSTSAKTLAGHAPDLIVFPEHIDRSEFTLAETLCPKAVIVGGVADGDGMRRLVRHRGEDRIDYMKILDDGRTRGARYQPERTPVYESGELAVGILICLDILEPTLVHRVVEDLRGRTSRLKVLCVPAAMHAGSWSFEDDVGILGQAGIHAVVVANGDPTYPTDRMRSFIFDRTCSRRYTEDDNRSPIVIDLGS